VLFVLVSAGTLSCRSQMPFLSGPRLATDELKGDTRSQKNLEVFDTAWELIYRQYFDPDLKAVDWERLRQVYRNQADTASNEAVLYQILGRMTAALEDGHTRVQSPEAVVMEAENVTVSIGLRGEWIDETFVVLEVNPFSPAETAGIRPGWVLSKWEGIPFGTIGGRGTRYSVRKDQEVDLTFVDPQDGIREVSLVGRDYPAIDPEEARLINDGTLYIRFDRFSGETAAMFAEQMRSYPDISGLVVDLRTNRGGQLSALKDILSHFYAAPINVGEEIERDGQSSPLRVQGSGRRAYEGALVVLVDRGSQSAAEVFAAAIQETGRGAVVGRRTAGNVLVSHRQTLPDGGELRISTHDYVTVTGKRLEGNGVEPDVRIEVELEDARQGTDRAVEMALQLVDVLNERKAAGIWAG
jgi:carboxyl-terminal processing protease